MPVRDFTDAAGRQWLVWNVIPESLHPKTRNEYYLANMYETGWLVFETKAGEERRRLTEIPPGWNELDDAGLTALLDRAVAIPTFTPRVSQAVPAPPPPPRASDEQEPEPDNPGPVRVFRYPGGRYWAAALILRPEGRKGPVLRFTSGAREIDAQSWPDDWADLSDSQLIELLRKSPRESSAPPSPNTPRRRWNDAHP